MPTYRLVMRSGPSSGKVFPMEKAELFVGRDLNNDIVINDPEVSRRHARFFVQGNSYVLEDLGSTNGTFINGQRLASPYPLRAGEVITFGERINVVFEIVVVDEDATIASAPARPAEVPYQPPIPPPAQQQAYAPPPAYTPPPAQSYAPPPAVQPVQPARSAYAGQVPYQAEPPKPASRTRMLMIIAIILLVVICLCVAAGLYFAPKEFWCVFPVWPEGACP